MISIKNIHSLTDFRRNASNYVGQVRETKLPLVLTVNGEAAVIVQDAHAFQQVLERLESAEQELKSMKLDALRKDIAVGIEQLETGNYVEHDEDTLSDLFADIKTRGRRRLAENGTL